jgi:hypothetical protein
MPTVTELERTLKSPVSASKLQHRLDSLVASSLQAKFRNSELAVQRAQPGSPNHTFHRRSIGREWNDIIALFQSVAKELHLELPESSEYGLISLISNEDK